MSRSVKDLRDLICVSRLTVRHSDEETFQSDEEEQVIRAFSRLSHDGERTLDMYRPESVMYTRTIHETHSPDSGIGTNGQSPEVDSQGPSVESGEPMIAPHPPSSTTRSGASRRKKKKSTKTVVPLPPMHELPRSAPLPPVRSNPLSPTVRPTSPSSSEDEFSEPVLDSKQSQLSRVGGQVMQPKLRTNFDKILTYMDATLVSEWLGSANENVSEMSEWIHCGDNFIQFAHFWLSEFPHLQRQEIFHMENSIIVDHLNLGFAAGRSAGAVLHRDIMQFLEAVFKEYPSQIMSSKGPHLFLNHLDILTSERHHEYKRLLSDVLCSTNIKQYAQWTLATRAFALVSSWTAIVNFYRKLFSDSRQRLPSTMTTMGVQDPSMDRIYHAIRCGYVDVVHYLLASGKVSARCRDSQGRTLIFTAVMHNQPEILRFLLRKVSPRPDVNLPADNGNSPLHAAANNGDVLLVTTLLRAEGINVNPMNAQCENATPLQLAVMHGHIHVVEVLLVAGADPKLTMGGLSVLDMARDFGHDEIYKVLQGGGLDI